MNAADPKSFEEALCHVLAGAEIKGEKANTVPCRMGLRCHSRGGRGAKHTRPRAEAARGAVAIDGSDERDFRWVFGRDEGRRRARG